MRIEKLEELLEEIEGKTRPVDIQLEDREIKDTHVFKNHTQLGYASTLDEDTIIANKYTVSEKDENGDYNIVTEGFQIALKIIYDDARISEIVIYVNSNIKELTEEQTRFILQRVYNYVDFWSDEKCFENELVKKYQLD